MSRSTRVRIKPYAEMHQQGTLCVENVDIHGLEKMRECDFGLQIAEDGRVWICLNRIAFLRFSPWPNGTMTPDVSHAKSKGRIKPEPYPEISPIERLTRLHHLATHLREHLIEVQTANGSSDVVIDIHDRLRLVESEIASVHRI